MKTPSPHRPNLLFLFSEQHHPEALSPAGNPHIHTPALQRLADEGVYFRNAYCATPLCIPSRTSTLLGRYSHATGIVDNENQLDRIGDQPNLARNLRKAGYRSCHIGKTHLGTSWDESPERMQRLGFEESIATRGKIGMARDWKSDPYLQFQVKEGIREPFVRDYERRAALRKKGWFNDCEASVLDPEETHDGWISHQALSWLEQVDTERPFYLSVNWAGPHVYRDPPAPYDELYDPEQMPAPITDSLEGAPEWLQARQHKESRGFQEGDWKAHRAAYYAQITMIDDAVGRILSLLEQRNLLENTLIIFAADHGEMLLDHGMIGKTLMYESSVRIPFLARYPAAFPAGLRPQSLISLCDLAPTLLEWAGADPLPDMHGESLSPLLQGQQDDRDLVFSEFRDLYMCRQGAWKLIQHPDGDLQLFQLDRDPDECRNLAEEEPDRVRNLQNELQQWLMQGRCSHAS